MTDATNSELLTTIRRRLQQVHGSRLRGVVLYGSQARGDARCDSDIDILVLLEGPVDFAADLEKNLRALYPLARQLERRISAKPVSADQYAASDSPLYRRARREGLAA